MSHQSWQASSGRPISGQRFAKSHRSVQNWSSPLVADPTNSSHITFREIFMTEFKGKSISDSAARIYGPVLYELAQRHGGLLASTVLAEAKRKASPIHNYFEWDDTAAAQAHRLWQAGQLIRSIEVVVIDNGESESVRAFHSVRHADDERMYQTIEVVKDTPEYRDQIIEKARREFESWRKRWRKYQELDEIFNVVDKAFSASE